MGLDSLDQTIIVSGIEHEFNMVMPDTQFTRMKTLNDVVDVVLKTPTAY